MVDYDRRANFFRTIEASTTHLVTGSPTTGVRIPMHEMGLVAVLDVTAATTGDALDKLDVILQTKIGSLWHDVIWFTQLDGDSGAETYIAKIELATAMTEYEEAAVLGETNARDIMGDQWRVRRVVTDGAGAGSHSFTYSVVACPY